MVLSITALLHQEHRLSLEPQSLAQLLALFKYWLSYAILLGLTICFDRIVHQEEEKIVIINLVNSNHDLVFSSLNHNEIGNILYINTVESTTQYQ